MKNLEALGLIVIMACSAMGCGEAGETIETIGVEIVSPAPDALVFDTVDVEISLVGPVRHVELLARGEPVGQTDVPEGGKLVTIPWDTGDVEDGVHSLVARALIDSEHEGRSEPMAVKVDNTAPQAAFLTGWERLGVVSGTVSIPLEIDEANVTRIRVLDGDVEVFTSDEEADSFTWETTGVNDGPHTLTMEVTDAAGHSVWAEAPLAMVVNRGEEVVIAYLPAAELSIPENWENAEHHVRVATDSVPNIRRIISWVTWDADADWLIEYAVGQGLCPHRGIKYTAAESRDGEIFIDLAREDMADDVVSRLPLTDRTSDVFPHNTDPRTFGAYFGHVAAMNPGDHVNETLPFEVHYIFIYAE